MKQITENRKQKTVDLFGVPISITSKDQALAVVGDWVKEWRQGIGIEARKSSIQTQAYFPKLITTPNPEMIVAAQRDPEFLRALQSADLAIPDGIGIIWALKLLGYQSSVVGYQSKVDQLSVSQSKTGKLKTGKPETENGKPKTDNWPPSRLSGLNLMESLIALAAQKGWRVMLVGGKQGVAQKAAKILSENSENSENRTVRLSDDRKTGNSDAPVLRKSDFSGSPSFPSVLKIESLSGPQDIEKASPHELNDLLNSINSFSPDLLFVAFGHGKQEKWLRANRHRLRAGAAMGVGGALDQITDPSLRPPSYIDSIGLGWFSRLARQPWRWRRQMALVKFVGMVINYVVFHKNHENLRKTRKILQKGL